MLSTAGGSPVTAASACSPAALLSLRLRGFDEPWDPRRWCGSRLTPTASCRSGMDLVGLGWGRCRCERKAQPGGLTPGIQALADVFKLCRALEASLAIWGPFFRVSTPLSAHLLQQQWCSLAESEGLVQPRQHLFPLLLPFVTFHVALQEEPCLGQ